MRVLWVLWIANQVDFAPWLCLGTSDIRTFKINITFYRRKQPTICVIWHIVRHFKKPQVYFLFHKQNKKPQVRHTWPNGRETQRPFGNTRLYFAHRPPLSLPVLSLASSLARSRSHSPSFSLTVGGFSSAGTSTAPWRPSSVGEEGLASSSSLGR